MNCNRFRFLIQQRFDTEISPQDDRALLAHIETCESCQKFHHQVQQVILATEELNIPEELQPEGLDDLAGKIKTHIPVSKRNFVDAAFGLISSVREVGILKKLTGAKAKEDSDEEFSAPKKAAKTSTLEKEALANKIAEVKIPETKIVSGAFRPVFDVSSEVSDRPAQSKSLGEKFGLPSALNPLSDTGGIQGRNLAESILKLKKASDLQRQTFEKLGNDSEISMSQAPAADTNLQGPRGGQFDNQSLANQRSSSTPPSIANANKAFETQAPPRANISFPPSQPTGGKGSFNSQDSSNPNVSGPAPIPTNPNRPLDSNPSVGPNFPMPGPVLANLGRAFNTQIPSNANIPFAAPGPADLKQPFDGQTPTNVNFPLPSSAPANISGQFNAQAPANANASAPQPTAPSFNQSQVGQAPVNPNADALIPVPSNLNKAVESWGKSWGSDAPKGSVPDSDWGPPPLGGVWEEPPEPTPNATPLKINNYSEGETTLDESDRIPALSQDSLTQQGANPATVQTTNKTLGFISAWQEPTAIQGWSPSLPAETRKQVPEEPAKIVAPVQNVVQDNTSASPPVPPKLAAPQKTDVPRRPNWSAEAEQIETGTWQALAFNNEHLRAAAAMPAREQKGLFEQMSSPPPVPPSTAIPRTTPSSPVTPPVGTMAPGQQAPSMPVNATSATSLPPPLPTASHASSQSAPPSDAVSAIALPQGSEPSPKSWPAENLQFNPLEKNSNLSTPASIAPTNSQDAALTIQEKLDRFRTAELATTGGNFHVEQIAKIENAKTNAKFPNTLDNNEADSLQQPKPLVKQEAPDTDLSPKITPVVSKKNNLNKEEIVWTQSDPETSLDVKEKPIAVPPPKISPIRTQSSPAPVLPTPLAASGKVADIAPSPERKTLPDVPSTITNNSDSSGLFNLDDNAMDQLFKENLGVTEPAFQANPKITEIKNNDDNGSAPLTVPNEPHASIVNTHESQSLQHVPPAENISPISAKPKVEAFSAPLEEATGPLAGKLFSIDDNMMDNIFSEQLGVADMGLKSASKVPESVEPTNADGLGTPSSYKVHGIGRLDSRSDTTNDTTGAGKITSIGKFLLDGPDLENIGKLAFADPAETKMRILTMEAATELKSLLQHIDSQPNTVGSIIIGHDQLLIANTMPSDLDAESVGQLAFSIYMNTLNVSNKMGYEVVRQIVSKTPNGYLIIADFGDGLLVTVSDAQEINNLTPLLQSIDQLAVS